MKASLVIMAAGIGSRFGGGIKQLEPIGPNKEIIIDYSIHDAIEAGFDKVVFVIRKDLDKDFREVIGNRIAEKVEVAYAYQELDKIPSKYQEAYKGRTKPWGTGQAILVCKDIVKEPFLVINADDYYGKSAYKTAYDYLTGAKRYEGDASDVANVCGGLSACVKADACGKTGLHEVAMVSFILKNTLSDFGTVTRGVCQVGEDGYLQSIVETSNIEKAGANAIVRGEHEDERLDLNVAVSMNMWGLFPEFFQILEKGFEEFLESLEADASSGGYKKTEYLLPTIIGNLLEENKLAVRVLESKDKWFGVTYKEDKETVIKGIQELIDKGLYDN